MGIFCIFRKRTLEDKFRRKVRKAFRTSVKDVKSQLTGNSLTDGLMVEAAVGNMRRALLSTPELLIIGIMQDSFVPEKIIDEECNRIMRKYLKN